MVLKNRQVIIMQGLSGSGKTTLAQANYPNATVISADLYFSKRTGKYEFDPKLLNKAHSWCLRRFINELDRGTTTIIVDNTNTERWEWCNYAKLAAHWGYKWGVIDMSEGDKSTDEELADRNVHGVTAEAIARQRERYSHARPEELYSQDIGNVRHIWISRASCGCPLIIKTEDEYNEANENNWSDYYRPSDGVNYISGWLLGECEVCGPVSYDERFIKTNLNNEQIQKRYSKKEMQDGIAKK